MSGSHRPCSEFISSSVWHAWAMGLAVWGQSHSAPTRLQLDSNEYWSSRSASYGRPIESTNGLFVLHVLEMQGRIIENEIEKIL